LVTVISHEFVQRGFCEQNLFGPAEGFDLEKLSK
jgi:hypothetical protein